MPDHDEIAEISRQMTNAAIALGKMSNDVAKAKQILAWESERRKALLAKFAVVYLDQEIAAGASELRARAHPDYVKGMAEMIQQSRSAEEVVARHDAIKAEWESARSLLAVQRQILGLV